MPQLKLEEIKKIDLGCNAQHISYADESGLLAVATDEGELFLINPLTTEKVFKLNNNIKALYSLKVSDDSSMIAGGIYGKLIIVDTKAGKVNELSSGDGPVMGVSVTKSGLATCRNIYGMVSLFDREGKLK